MKQAIGKLLVVFAVLFLFSSSASAQSVDQPMIYVHDFTISTTTLIAGATVPGSATLVNNGDTDVPEVSYIVTIVGDYKDGDPYTTFDTQTLGKVYVPAHGSKVIKFAYTVPPYLNGTGYGMELTAGLPSGLLLGWGTKKVTIKGSPERSNIAVSNIVLPLFSILLLI